LVSLRAPPIDTGPGRLSSAAVRAATDSRARSPHQAWPVARQTVSSFPVVTGACSEGCWWRLRRPTLPPASTRTPASG